MVEGQLELVETRALMREILSRCDGGIIAYVKRGETPHTSTYAWRWVGDNLVCMGLAASMQSRIQKSFDAEMADEDDK